VHAGRLLLVALGPLSNLALALKLDPTLPQRVARLVVMGGAVTAHGNITPAAEFNIAFDPEAAHIVFSAFAHVDWPTGKPRWPTACRMPTWSAGCRPIPRARRSTCDLAKTRLWSADRRGDRWHSADALAMAYALEPDGARETIARPLAVELTGASPRRHRRRLEPADRRG
jgi:purine nucleosidase